MSKEVVIARLTRMVAADVDPTLDALDLEYALTDSRLVDENGRSWTDADWEPTYNFNKAAAQLWEQKAAKCSNRFNFSSDVNSFQREQVFKHCVEMANRYRSKGIATVTIADIAYDPVISNL